jgi:hypothetical protein
VKVCVDEPRVPDGATLPWYQPVATLPWYQNAQSKGERHSSSVAGRVAAAMGRF